MAAIAGCAVPCVTGLNLTPTSQAFPKSSVQQLRNVTANALPAVAKLTVNEARARVLFSRRLSRSLRVSPSLSGVPTASPRGSRRATRAMSGTSPGNNQSEDRDESSASDLSRVCVVGCGGLCIDYLATVSAFPHPDDKIRSTSFEVQGGGNVGNTLTAISRLGLSTRIFTKLADDLVGKAMIAELQADGVDTSHIIVGKGGMSPSTYIIVDQQTNTRTCIHTPGSPPLLPSELSAAALTSLLSGASLAYFDGRLADTTIRICQQAVALGLPVLVDAEKPREGLDDLLAHATYVVVSEKFPQAWTGEETLGAALLAMAVRLPRARFIIVTLGADGCAMLDRRVAAASEAPSEDVDKALQWVIRAAQEKGSKQGNPVVFSSRPLRLKSMAQGTEVAAQLVAATAVPLEAGQVVDTTGAGDAFIGAVLYAISAGFTVDRMLILGATIAAAKCQALGARQGLPRRDDPRLTHLFEPERAVASGL